MKMREGLFKGIFLEINIKNQLALIFDSPEVHLQEFKFKFLMHFCAVSGIASKE